MPGPRVRRISLEFDDGTTASARFEDLPLALGRELMAQPFAAKPSPEPEAESCVILEWDDGWKEVLKVDAECGEINRYYVISRPEDVGRLSLTRPDGYPELIEIGRQPLGLKRITFRQSFGLAFTRTDREGHKQDHFFGLDPEGETFADEAADFERAAADLGIDPASLRQADPDGIQDQCERIGRRMGLKAARCQQDLRDFIAHLARSAR